MPAFRNLTVVPDIFSSFPDHFAFGHINEIELLWGDNDFDYSKQVNIPLMGDRSKEIEVTKEKIFFNGQNYTEAYDAHVECYALYKSKLESKFKTTLTHPQVVQNYLSLIDHDVLKICWFNKDESFRSITQALMFPWWTEESSKSGKYKVWVPGYKIDFLRHTLGLIKSKWVISKKHQETN